MAENTRNHGGSPVTDITGDKQPNFGEKIVNRTVNTFYNILNNADFMSRAIGTAGSYDDIMMFVQKLGREPVSLLGKNFMFIFDHVTRIYNQGVNVNSINYNECPKFTFYKDPPKVRFADPYNDPMNLKDAWSTDFLLNGTISERFLISYSESNDGISNNKTIPDGYDIENANPGVNKGFIRSFGPDLKGCDMIAKTNANFNSGKYRTLIARFHTNSDDSKDPENITQTAISSRYGMSHGRNLLKIKPTTPNGYDNPYCRVWTYHHQYNQMARAIRPFGEVHTQVELESLEQGGDFDSVGFRTIQTENGFKGGSERLDTYGVLNYNNGFVNIAPTASIEDYFKNNKESDKEISVKKCMFSIENLAWKTENMSPNEYDQYGLSAEQKGPMGGRIMWFPPYGLKFNESVNTDWNSNKFIGRGEDVYTYINTTRSGQLNFMLLIDHPSILDYWNGLERNGMENQGVSLLPGNTDGVDGKDNQENTLLRFFAGCDVLTAIPQKFKKRIEPPLDPEEEEEEPINNTPPASEEAQPTITETIHCVLYYPNNYSGVNDAPTVPGSKVNAIYYLMNGAGCQKVIDNNYNAVDLATSINTKIKLSKDADGGYEIGNNGISIVNDYLKTVSAAKSTYSNTAVREAKAQYITGPNGKSDGLIEAGYGGELKPLVKIVGSDALSYGNCTTKTMNDPYDWQQRRYYYRVDDAYVNQVFTRPISYIDTKSNHMNGSGYMDPLQNESLVNKLKINLKDSNTKVISFADLFAGVEGTNGKNIVSEEIDSSNVNLVKKIIESPDIYYISDISFVGLASQQGYVEENKKLSLQRAETFKNWLVEKKFPQIGLAKVSSDIYENKNNVNVGGDNDKQHKMWRCACLTIKYEMVKTENAVNAEKTAYETSYKEESSEKEGFIPKVDRTGELLKKTMGLEAYGNMVNDINIAFYGKPTLDEHIIVNKMLLKHQETEAFKKAYANVSGLTNVRSGGKEVEGVVQRYDNEGEFFKQLQRNEAFLHSLTCDKIKYFDPAFHSISPEGFNARLTFLHQCTRQGPTVGNDSLNGGSAYNLAFGRPPVCVLRIGDFYNTKIIIESMTIDYDDQQWDLNPEGIGVMPMIANVSITFKFLGGSDLAGPISRLQNAVSFNYYANTGVYDNRAEMVLYEDNNSGREKKFKPYVYPLMTRTDGKLPKANETGTGPMTKEKK